MVEEFMLLANISVAEKILAEFPDCALLRRHPSPPPANFDPLIATAKSKVAACISPVHYPISTFCYLVEFSLLEKMQTNLRKKRNNYGENNYEKKNVDNKI